MKDDAASLDRLHNIVAPPPVSWWPPAPGWYVVFVLLVGVLLVTAVWFIKKWRANAYRREALRALERATEAAGVSAILRRTALVGVSRDTVAELSGAGWVKWLESKTTEPMPKPVGDQLARGIYEPAKNPDEVSALREYAASWIRNHRVPEKRSG